MAGDDEPRKPPEGASGDLFEDLDQFFASIDESEWPEGVEPEGAGTAPSPRRRGRHEAPEPSDQMPDQVSGEDEADVEPPGPGQGEYEDVFVSSSEEDKGAEPAEEPPPSEPGTQEMTQEDWARLRDVLGEEEDEVEAFTFEEVPTELSPEESLFGYASPEGAEPDEEQVLPGYGDIEQPEEADMAPRPSEPEEPELDEDLEPGALTLEDLKKAPPQYQDLPGVETGGVGEPSASREPPPPLPDVEAGEPTLAEVEAAADQLAEEFQIPGGVEEDLLSDLGAKAPPAPRTVRVGEPESLMGPAWEDPTTSTVSTERPPALGGGRNLPAAVITGALLAVAALIFVLVSKPAFAILAGAVVLFGQLELYATMQRREYQPATLLGLFMGGFTMAAAYLKGEEAMLFVLALSVLLSLLWYMAAPPKGRTGLIGNVGATLLGLAYAPFLAGYVLLILVIPEIGRSLMLAVLGITFAYDIGAFIGGSLVGSRPLAPSISPRKSWEGALAGSFVALILSIGIVPSIDPMSLGRAVGLALVVAIFAPLGDLTESMIKRDLGVKDMGTILPGHGGILDRIDSALFVAPASYYFFRLIFL